MNELENKAKIYASEKVNGLMAKVIAQAYMDGYQNGYSDRDKNIGESVPTNDKTSVHDLGLPSGTQWTLGYLEDENEETKYLPYAKASQLGLPSKEQVDELMEKCRWQGHFSSSGMTFYGAVCIGSNGERIILDSKGYKEDERTVGAPNYGGGNAYFWIQDDEDGDEKNAVRIYGVENRKPMMEIVKIFSGYKLPVLLVGK